MSRTVPPTGQPMGGPPMGPTDGDDALSRWDNEGGATSRPGAGRRLRFLIVSADPQISLSLAAALDGIGHQACALALTNDQAARSARTCHPDMIIADAYLEDDERLTGMAPMMRALFVPCMVNAGGVVPHSLLRPGAVVLRRPFRVSDLTRAIRLTLENAGASSTGYHDTP